MTIYKKSKIEEDSKDDKAVGKLDDNVAEHDNPV
jgi:hypothetical protein